MLTDSLDSLQDLLPAMEAYTPPTRPGGYRSVRDVFDGICGDLKVDRKFIEQIHAYAIGFVNKNAEHVEFFGSNLIGVHPVRFMLSDREMWFNDILDVDEDELRDLLHALPEINPNFNVSSDVMNLSMVWTLYRIHNAPNLTEAQREQGKLDVVCIFHYKVISSLMAYNFKYPADKAVAAETYKALSKKYDLKQYGSWGALIVARAKDVIARTSIHYLTYTRMKDDKAVVYMVNDMQGRIRDVIKNILEVFYAVRDRKGGILTSSSTITLDGVTMVRDQSKQATAYKRYIHEVVTNRESWIRTELIGLVMKAMHTLDGKEGLLRQTLTYMSDNAGHPKAKEIDELLDETLYHMFDYMTTRNIRTNDIGELITRLKAVYMSSRSSDPVLLKMRELGDKVVSAAIASKNAAVIASVRTAIFIYIVLRTRTMNYYA